MEAMKSTVLRTGKWLAAGLVVVLLASGCTTRYSVRVDGLAASDWQSRAGLSYSWQSAMDEVAEDDLFFKEVTAVLDRAMQSRGFRRAADGQPADMVVRVSAHLSEPLTETRNRSEPLYAERRGHTRVIAVPVVDSSGKVVSYVRQVYWDPPRTEVVGFVNNKEQITVYDKVLRLSARGAQGGPELWSLSVALRGRSTDYRSFLPYLVAAAKPYLGVRTEGELVIEIAEDAAEVQSLR
jgi:hypothetical protein